MTPRSRKATAILAGLLIGGATLLSWTQTWIAVTLRSGLELDIAGDVAAPALAALGLATLALAAALSLAGPIFRIVLGVLQVAISGGVILASLGVFADPGRAARPTISEATGVAGAESVAALIDSATLTAWPTIAVVLGALGVLHGVFVLVTARTWPRGGRRFETTQSGAGSDTAVVTHDAIDDWDALSGGEDPTAR